MCIFSITCIPSSGDSLALPEEAPRCTALTPLPELLPATALALAPPLLAPEEEEEFEGAAGFRGEERLWNEKKY